jgi:hypothetical protein
MGAALSSVIKITMTPYDMSPRPGQEILAEQGPVFSGVTQRKNPLAAMTG